MGTVEVGLPEKMSVYQEGSYLVVVRKWFGWRYLILLAFAAVWDGFVFFWYTHVPASAPSPFFWFPLLHVGAGVFITYSAIAGLVNRTYVRVGRDTVTVRTGPLPWFSNRLVSASAIKQLYAKEHVSSNRGGQSCTFALHAILHEGRNIKLVSGLESSEQALYLEEKMEKYLSIEDAPVKGEL